MGATGRLRTGATWAPTLMAAGWVTGARTRAWGAALHPWEDQRWPLVRTAALECAAPCATGTPKNGATWELTPTDAGWAIGARTCLLVAALMSPWSARGASWRRRRLWLTALKGNPSALDPAQTMAPRMDLTMAPSMDLTMASTMAQALTKIIPNRQIISSGW